MTWSEQEMLGARHCCEKGERHSELGNLRSPYGQVGCKQQWENEEEIKEEECSVRFGHQSNPENNGLS